MRPLLLVLLAARSVECGRPTVLPASIPDPLAYYQLDDGSGFDLLDTVSGSNAGRVIYAADHQSTTYTDPNWTDDERFGKAIQCGAKDGANEQKDTLQLADVDYGHSGAWSLSVWFRHDVQDFVGKEREQFIVRVLGIGTREPSRRFHPARHRFRLTESRTSNLVLTGPWRRASVQRQPQPLPRADGDFVRLPHGF